jgi:hypothetical protein
MKTRSIRYAFLRIDLYANFHNKLFIFSSFKYYFFKAQYKSGAQFLAASKIDFVWIRKDEIKDFIKNKDYLECLHNFILDF